MKNIILKIDDIIKFRSKSDSIDRITIFSYYVFFLLIMILDYLTPIFKSLEMEGKIFNVIVYFILFLIYIFIYNIRNKRIKFTIDFYLMTIFLVFCFISTFVSNNPFRCIIGDITRNEGLCTYLMYYLIYLNSKVLINKKQIIEFINIVFFIGIFQTFIAFLQVFTNGSLLIIKGFEHMGFGLCGNPNFFGNYTMFLCLIGICLCLFYKGHTKYHIVSTIILYIGLILGQSSGPFFGFIFTLIFIYFILRKKKIKTDKFIIWISSFVFLYALVNYSLIGVNKYIYHYEVDDSYTISGDIGSIANKTLNFFFKTNKEVTSNMISHGRIAIWKDVIKNSKYNVLFGVGPDNLLIGMPTLSGKLYMVDKAHNIYLNVYATTGLLSCIVYIMWVIYVNVKSIKSKNILVLIMFIGFVGYNIQGISNINVIEVMPYYFIFTGIMMGLVDNKNKSMI